MKPTQSRSGFTLIEILVVVAIIALLISILLPSLRKARDEAKKAVCVSNLSQLGKASTAYLQTYDNRFYWGWDATYIRTWLFGGTKGEGSPDLTWFKNHVTNKGANARYLNKFVTPTRLGERADLPVYQCPSDSGLTLSSDPLDTPTAEPAHFVTGTSYQSNLGWSYYAKDAKVTGWGEGAGNPRVTKLMDSIIRVFERKGASKAVLLYEDRADVALTGALNIPIHPSPTKLQGWHGEANKFSMLFLDGHAANMYVEYWKNLDHEYDSFGGFQRCNPSETKRCFNGSAHWFARQDYKAE